MALRSASKPARRLGALFAWASLLVERAAAGDRPWVLGPGTVASSWIGALGANGLAATGTGYSRCIAVIASSLAAGVAIAHVLFALQPGNRGFAFAVQ